MIDDTSIMITESDRATARADVKKTSRGTTVGGIGMVAVTTLIGAVLGELAFPNRTGILEALAIVGFTMVLTVPLLASVARMAQAKGIQHGSFNAAQERVMRADAHRRDFETRLGRALEMADDEVAAFDIV